MEKMQIKLKECCLDCEYFSPDGFFGLCSDKREISCSHMPVCERYNRETIPKWLIDKIRSTPAEAIPQPKEDET